MVQAHKWIKRKVLGPKLQECFILYNLKWFWLHFLLSNPLFFKQIRLRTFWKFWALSLFHTWFTDQFANHSKSWSISFDKCFMTLKITILRRVGNYPSFNNFSYYRLFRIICKIVQFSFNGYNKIVNLY